MKKVRIAILGLGNVGSGVWKILNTNREEISIRSGYEIEVAKILVRNKNKARDVDVPEEILTTDFNEILEDDSIRIVVELMGGIEPAKDYILQVISRKKHVVTANKFVLATQGKELMDAAKREGVMLYFEASVAGGVPIINTISQSLTANKIEEIFGIINGTTNFILTKMSQEGMEFDEALKLAQELGFAEADPTSDIEGYDAMYKLGILSELSFNCALDVDSIYREGITGITAKDIQYAKEFGYTIKLLAIAKEKDGELELRVHPAMISSKHPLANVNDAFNAIFIKGNAVGDLMFYGKGAGDLPTGSAVVGDIISILRNDIDDYTAPATREANSQLKVQSMDDTECKYYLRFEVLDNPGTLADISSIFGKNGVSLASVIQKGKNEKEVPLVFITHKTLEKNINEAIKEIKKLPTVINVENIIRVEKI
ncbi:MAG TPA: homoserine dehydrogenase [Clostridium sp.]|jgi:homoserine dehydrogenase|nr:homoserine dehydrogenase [Clostridia bacterium]HCW05324.1 homoserine dehydrogenase [Clostridium sp.]